MTRFCGALGIATTEKTAPGVWEEKIKDRTVYGESKSMNRRLENGVSINDNITVNNMIEIMADEDILANFFNIRYVIWMGVKWKISNIDVQPPRLVLTLGGIYNGDEEGTE